MARAQFGYWIAGCAYGSCFLIKKGTLLSEILVDADGCPVKQEVYHVAKHYGLKITVVSNPQMHIPSVVLPKYRYLTTNIGPTPFGRVATVGTIISKAVRANEALEILH